MTHKHTIINEMLVALTANIEYLSQNGNVRVRVRNGQLMQSVGDKFIYEFSLEFLQKIEQNAEIEIRVGGSAAAGTVSALNEGSVQVELDKNLGDKISQALLVISSHYLLELLKDRLQKIHNGEIPVSDLAWQVFGDDTSTSLANYIPPASKSGRLNSYQLEALQLALGSPVSFIWGPPGTGKTQTIASIIEGFMAHGKSVLLLSHTNKATDEALLKVVKHLGNENDDYQNGKIIRFGEIILDELKQKYVTPAKIAEKNGRGIKEDIKKLEAEICRLQKETATSTEILRIFERWQEVEGELDNIRQYISDQQHAAKVYKTEIKSAHAEIASLKLERSEYEHKGMIGKLFATRKPRQLEQRIAYLIHLTSQRKEQVDEIRTNLREAKNKQECLVATEKQIAAELPDKDYDYHKDLSDNGGMKVLKLLEEQGQLEKQLEELQENLVLEAKVVATTLTKSYSSKALLGRQYDCVIIDEVSMAPLPAVFCASGLAQTNVVLVGDFLQLPPIAQHKVIRTKDKSEERSKEEERLVYNWLMRDIFALSGVEDDIRKGSHPGKLRQLKRQYRMHESIAEIVNKVAYARVNKDCTIETARATTEGRLPLLLDKNPSKGAHVAFYDTSVRAPIASRLDGGSYYNLYNALVCVELAKQALQSGYESVGIISAYRAQVNLIQKMLADTFKKDKKVMADTVHRFQGGERQVVIIDITTPSTRTMYDEGQVGGNDMKLLNVAISRSQEKCIFVGDLKQIIKLHSPSSPVRTIIEHITQKHYPVYNTEEMMDCFKVTAETDEWLARLADSPKAAQEMEKSKLFDETDFYGQFIKDMLGAQREVIIDSPYMTTRRVNELYKYFEELRRKDVEIYILTRIPKEQDGKMQYYSEVEIKRLTELGIKVLPFVGKIHRKIAIIDHKLLWEGSLNILSQNDSREIMRRFDGEASARQMMSFLKLDKNLGEPEKPALRHCEFCKSPIAWYWTDTSPYGGLWTSCLLNHHKEGVPPKGKAQLKQIENDLRTARKAVKERASDGTPICPRHNLVMIRRKGPFGEFWGCSRYPVCKVTERIKITTR